MEVATVIAFFIGITALFRVAAGNLGLRTLNVVSVTYYTFVIMAFFGASLAYLGVVNGHYLVAKASLEAIRQTFFLVALTGLVLPIIVIGYNAIFGNIRAGVSLRRKIEQPFNQVFSSKRLYTVSVILLIVCAAATIYTFVSIGSIPALDLLVGSETSAAEMRAEAGRGFRGIELIRNLFMLTLAPLVSFLCLISYRAFGSRNWRNLFFLSFALTVVALTYNLEKGPIVYYVLFLFIILQLVGIRPSVVQMAAFGGVVVLLVLIGYFLTYGTAGLVLSFENGPVSRLVTTSIATLMLHIQTFPDQVSFLGGRSLPSLYTDFLGLDDGWIRSGRIVMELYNPNGVAAGVAGVMNALFIGEAYANWGYFGVLVSWFVVGSYVGISSNVFLNSSKSVISVLFYIVMIKFNMNTLFGGFTEYVYSINLAFSLVVIASVAIFSYKGSYDRRRLFAEKGHFSWRLSDVLLKTAPQIPMPAKLDKSEAKGEF